MLQTSDEILNQIEQALTELGLEPPSEIASQIITDKPVTTPDGKKIVFIDASILKGYSCKRNFFWTAKENYQKKHESKTALAFGSAVHIFLEHFYRGLSVTEALKKAETYYAPHNANVRASEKEYRVTSHLLNTCILYAKRYPRNREGNSLVHSSHDFIPLFDSESNKAVEYKFAIPLWSNDKYQLVLTGTVDLPCKYVGYPLILADHKTTSTYISEADKLFEGYKLDIQTMLYSKVYRECMNLPYYPPIVINGIFLKKPTIKAEKEGIFDGADFKRSGIIEYKDDQMETFNVWFDSVVKEIIEILSLATSVEMAGEKYNYPYNLSACHSIYGKCKFFEVCKLPRQFHDGVLKDSYMVKQYNPLKFR